ncbi:tyrosine phosphatase [Kwoniella heveanensis CBS 569]|uniref:M-phase inducer phosphatase n=1 Tax=Kwoniella heveanensis BCC8398 TaxID=1296120 RepID=A0A1B9GKV3_9TREE|nr:tyrosine phosphatase [Kwoniella heveanensis BCC8398]OCF43381.1 tyrosine phosphatase [Kwoniella heveanensis CBS 569]
MDCFSSSPLMESFPSSRFPSPVPSPTQTASELPIEVDQSFNSSMSLGDTSPMFSPTPTMQKAPIVSPLPSGLSKASFLSPSPVFGLKPRRPDPVPLQRSIASPSKSSSLDIQDSLKPISARPLAQGRTFGRELSTNIMQRSAGPATTKANKGKMLPPTLPDGKTTVRTRGGIPMQWTSSNEETGRPRLGMKAQLFRRETDPSGVSLSPCSVASTSVSDDFGMDIDSPAIESRRPSIQASPSFSGAASFSGSPGLGSFFCDSPAAPAACPPAKRRSLVTGSPDSPSSGSPSAKRTSLGLGIPRPPLDKTASSSAMLFNGSKSNTLAIRRNPPYKRPALGPLASASTEMGPRTASATSAFPILYGPPKPTLGQSGTFPRTAMAPMRRAFSVCDQNKMHEMEEDESEYEASPSMAGTQAEYMRRYGPRAVPPRVDGSPGGFKPVRASIASTGQGVASPVSKKGKQKVSPYGPGGLPGFGDNEMDGKILPCHKVKEDGLVRITPNTLDDLLGGKYSDRIKRYHVIDCRFDYEFAGGHIAGAINVKSMDALDQLLLSESTGVHANGNSLPVPSRSGELGDGEQVVLVFHCEFSAKRAPTFAKHLRSRDRSLNNALYPKIFYPEVYILEGGYCGFYQTQPERCEPRGYTPMDDPKHFERRNSDLHDFRKFSRTRSFTYGEQPSQPSRAALPCPPLAFAAASAATARRHGPTIAEEDHENESSPSGGDSSMDMGSGTEASPCPRAVSMGQPPIFGSAKTRVLGRVGFHRVASYAGTGMGIRQ